MKAPISTTLLAAAVVAVITVQAIFGSTPAGSATVWFSLGLFILVGSWQRYRIGDVRPPHQAEPWLSVAGLALLATAAVVTTFLPDLHSVASAALGGACAATALAAGWRAGRLGFRVSDVLRDMVEGATGWTILLLGAGVAAASPAAGPLVRLSGAYIALMAGALAVLALRKEPARQTA